MSAQTSTELQWCDLKIVYQDSSPSNGHHDDMPYMHDKCNQLYMFPGKKKLLCDFYVNDDSHS